MNELNSIFLGIDPNKEIVNLWYEVTYLRHLLNYTITMSPDLFHMITPEIIQGAKDRAQEEMMLRFPRCDLTFGEKKLEKDNA
jgi:hypothetical protein